MKKKKLGQKEKVAEKKRREKKINDVTHRAQKSNLGELNGEVNQGKGNENNL